MLRPVPMSLMLSGALTRSMAYDSILTALFPQLSQGRFLVKIGVSVSRLPENYRASP